MRNGISFDFERDVSKVRGWLTESEGYFLYECAKKVERPDCIVEIGSWKGRSTICLAKGAQRGYGTEILSIDPHMSQLHNAFGQQDTYYEFITNLKNAGIEGYVNPIKSTSVQTSENFKGSVGLIFIDGAHDYLSVSADYKAWFDKIINGGMIAFHDSWMFRGPKLVTARELLTSTRIRNPRLVDTITCFDKVEKNSKLDRIRNAYFLIYRTLTGYKGARKLNDKSD